MPRTAAIYARISQDREGTEVGVDNQTQATRALADRLGLTVVATFTDNNIGASTRSRRERPGFAAMLAAADRGEFDAILAYSNSRLTRRPLEFESLITLHAQRGTAIRTVVSGDDDLSTADGRMTARIKAAADAAEAERTGERVAFAQAAKLAKGEDIGGRRPFGFEDDRVALREPEAALIRLGARMIVEDGATIYAVARAWDAAGIRPERWRSQAVRDILIRPRNAGRLVVGGVEYPGDRPQILTDVEYRDLLAALALNVKPRRGPKPQTTSAVTVVRCGVCGARVELTMSNGQKVIRCAKRGGGVRHPTLTVARAEAQLAAVALMGVIGAEASSGLRADIVERRAVLAEVERRRDLAREDVDGYAEREDRDHARARVATLTREVAAARAALDSALAADTTTAALEVARYAVQGMDGFQVYNAQGIYPQWAVWWAAQDVATRRTLLRGRDIELMPAVKGQPWRLRVDGVDAYPEPWAGLDAF